MPQHDNHELSEDVEPRDGGKGARHHITESQDNEQLLQHLRDAVEPVSSWQRRDME